MTIPCAFRRENDKWIKVYESGNFKKISNQDRLLYYKAEFGAIIKVVYNNKGKVKAYKLYDKHDKFIAEYSILRDLKEIALNNEYSKYKNLVAREVRERYRRGN